MKKILSLMILTVCSVGAGFSQKIAPDKKPAATKTENMQKISERKPFEYDNESTFDANGKMTRGAGVSPDAKQVSLVEVLKKPENFAGKTVAVEGVIVRSCKAEGCWMEIAPSAKDKSVRVTFQDRAFFIPLDSAGRRARAEGVFSVKTLSKAEADHLEKEDDAKFDKRSADGTVTEISFEATGVELFKPMK